MFLKMKKKIVNEANLQCFDFSPALIRMTSRQLGRDSQVWDPGARILIYSEHNNNNNINTVTGRNPSGGHLNVCANFNAKEKIRCLMQSSKPVSTRASPNKSQDSGFSDSGESESSSNNSEGNKGEEKCGSGLVCNKSQDT